MNLIHGKEFGKSQEKHAERILLQLQPWYLCARAGHPSLPRREESARSIDLVINFNKHKYELYCTLGL